MPPPLEKPIGSALADAAHRRRAPAPLTTASFGRGKKDHMRRMAFSLVGGAVRLKKLGRCGGGSAYRSGRFRHVPPKTQEAGFATAMLPSVCRAGLRVMPIIVGFANGGPHLQRGKTVGPWGITTASHSTAPTAILTGATNTRGRSL